MHIVQDEQFLNEVSGATILRTKKGLHRVYLLPNQLILKVIYSPTSFSRAKGLVKRFIKNIQCLQAKNITTISLSHWYEYPAYRAVALYYPRLEGETVFNLYVQTKDLIWILHAFNALAELTRKRIFFRDFNPGNILLDKTGNFALIDVQSVRFPWFFSLKHIIKPFKVFFNDIDAKSLFTQQEIYLAANHYLSQTNLSARKQKAFWQALQPLLSQFEPV